MQQYYAPLIEKEGKDFNTKEYSKFEEVQKCKICLIQHGFSIEDFAKWVVDNKFRMAIHVRYLPKVLENEKATQVFLEKGNDIEKAYDLVKDPKSGAQTLIKASFGELCAELAHRVNVMNLGAVKGLREDEETKVEIYDLKSEIDWFIKFIEE